ncbi:MAG: nuclear transport factor 2 family protein [Serratia rubidaea]|nr:nuclear transport factor 2 family protein [Serratia rubidaea]
MTQLTPQDIVLQALQQVVAQPQHQPAAIAAFFADDYRQTVDGQSLDYAQFVSHMALLKQITRRMTLRVQALAAQDDSVLSHHRVEVEKCDGTRSEIQVMAHFILRDGKIIACDELTRQLSGDRADHDLGGRY